MHGVHRQDLKMDGRVTSSRDIQLPELIVAATGRDIKIDFSFSDYTAYVSHKNDPYYQGVEIECTSDNILRLPSKTKNHLHLTKGEAVSCRYIYSSEILGISRKYDEWGAADAAKHRKKQEHSGSKTLRTFESHSVWRQPFDNKPAFIKGYWLTFRQDSDMWKQENDLPLEAMLSLCKYIRATLFEDDEMALLLIWRFVLELSSETIRYHIKTSRDINATFNAFRLNCKRIAGQNARLSDTSLRRIFGIILTDNDIIRLQETETRLLAPSQPE